MQLSLFVCLGSLLVGIAYTHPILRLAENLNKECGDHKTNCSNTYTCCPIDAKGGYGCCPIDKAVCCSDHEHCCPAGYKCDLTAKTCAKSHDDDATTLLVKIDSKTAPNIVTCPDQQTTCNDGNTCCTQANGKYGCCPLSSAVCCSDGVHCCPTDTTCTKNGRCVDMFLSLPMLEKTDAMAPQENCPDGKSTCPSGNTCCKLKTGEYGCCPQPKAVCCSDGVHCCPEGYTCDVSAGTCMKQSKVVPLLKKTSSFSKIEKTDLSSPQENCPDGKSTCPTGNTCCKLKTGEYGCCPQPNAVCCSDGVHCCPEGYTCDVSAGTCMKQSKVVPLLKKTFSKIEKSDLTSPNDLCPDQSSECPTGDTCCKLKTDGYGCCPQPNAVCCSDGVHCCPEGYTCDVSAGTCMKQSKVVPLLKKTSSFSKIGKTDLSSPQENCPDGKSTCPTGNTCCKLKTGEYGCCPQPNAVCCSDGVHCCPEGYTCDVSAGTCMKQSKVVPLLVKTSALKSLSDPPSSVMCADDQKCPEANTCCVKSDGKSYGCCPQPNAVCCSDHLHCCPNGYTCDVAESKCNKQILLITTAAITPKENCPDGSSSCPSGNTCCKLPSGEYGCCPQPNAVCCSDGIHCCPHGYTCDVSAGTCMKQSKVVPLLKKTAAQRNSLVAVTPTVRAPKNVICPGQQSQCPDGNTCCPLATSGYGCCPQIMAVCCSDHVHCCPSGYTCDLTNNNCIKGSQSAALLKKTPALKLPTDVNCPDGGQCKDGQTCCKVSDDKYGCCPTANAVCCSDMKHCCPSGYTCADGRCEKDETDTPLMISKLVMTKTSPESVVCKDGKTECPNQNTCCKLSDLKAYACCPLPQAVCCGDDATCCPNGHKCLAGSKCTRNDNSVVFLGQILLKKPKNVETVTCADGTSECEDTQTCCKLASGEYGCCPSPKAVCCTDGIHCCPQGTSCDVAKGTCNKHGLTVPFLEKLPALKSPKTVTCADGTSECEDTQTCCKLASGEYGCCPSPKAVCCTDGIHCCPQGTSCDVAKGTCNKQGLTVPFLEKLPALKSPKAVCPDGHSCPSTETCCKVSDDKYGCCPAANAVCCSDMKHCCPSGYTCADGQCEKDAIPTTLLKTNKPFNVATLPEDILCPDYSYCPDGNTCCQKFDGGYNCCPNYNGVCCSNNDCCPSEYYCCYSSGKPACCRYQKTNFLAILFTPNEDEAKVDSPNDNPCPNGDSCLTTQTCCKLADGDYGCCPSANAVCCGDHKHCCPSGEKCDTGAGTCSKGGMRMALFRNVFKPIRRLLDRDFL